MKFVNIRHLEEAVTHQNSEYAKIHNASPFLVVFDIPSTTTRDRIDSSALGEEIHVKICLDLPSNILVLEAMKSIEHEAVAGRFGFFIETKAEQMGLRLYICGGATVEAGEERKEQDAPWKSLPAPGAPQRTWPTVALEVGWSESINKLAVDAQGWIEAQGSEMQTVITIKIDRTTPKVTIQKWEEASDIRGMTPSGSSHHRTAETKQEVIIAHSNGINTVTGTLEIQFEKIVDKLGR